MLYFYNKSRGIQQTGIHRYRHTFAKQWVLNGGNVVTLSTCSYEFDDARYVVVGELVPISNEG